MDSTKITTALKNLRMFKDEHSKMGMEIMNAHGRAIYPMDILSFAVLNRSSCLLDAFCDLIEKQNFVAAAPLLRLQLDNLLRYRAAWLVENPHDLAMEVAKGTRIRDIKDKNGHKMTDDFLVKSMVADHPQLENIYKHTSGYIHLSEKHIFNSMKATGGDMMVSMKIGPSDEFIPEESYIEAISAFFEVTGTLFRYLEGWRVAKDRPLPKPEKNETPESAV